jgi:hypothetical protein
LKRTAVREVIENTAVSTQSLTDRAESAITDALADGKYSAVATLLRLQAELHGLLKKDADNGGLADLLKGATIINGQHVLNRIEIVVVDPAKPSADKRQGERGEGLPALAATRAIQGR